MWIPEGTEPNCYGDVLFSSTEEIFPLKSWSSGALSWDRGSGTWTELLRWCCVLCRWDIALSSTGGQWSSNEAPHCLESWVWCLRGGCRRRRWKWRLALIHGGRLPESEGRAGAWLRCRWSHDASVERACTIHFYSKQMSNKACSMYPCLVDEANSTICQKTEALEVVRPTKTGKSRSAATSRSKTVWAISERRGEEETLR